MAEVEGKKMTELRVIDLKAELERRGLDKTGNKSTLLERLSKAILEEGENPDECLIIPSGGLCKIAPKVNNETLNQGESTESSQESHKEEKADEQSNANKSEGEAKVVAEENNETTKKEEFQSEVKNNSAKEETIKQEAKMQGAKAASENTQNNDKKNDLEKTSASNQSSNATSTTVEANGIDNEDSINLTIGEDEENLLVEETESHDRHKDGGEKKKMEENSKKGDSKGSGGRAEAGVGGKEGTTSGANVGMKSKQDSGDGSKSVDANNKNQKREDRAHTAIHFVEKKVPISATNASSRNLWVSGLSSSTRATDLKQIFSKYGKVIGAKVVTNARTPGARCYGYVTMSTSEDATKCIQHLHRTELHGRVISVEKAKGDNQQSHIRKRDTVNGKSEKKEEKEKPKDHDVSERKEKEIKKETEEKGDIAKKSDDKNDSADSKKIEAQEKKEDSCKESDTRSTKSTSKKPESERSRREEKRIRTWDKDHRSHSRSRSRERRRRDDVLTFAKIREERERQRLRERERMLREEERRRREDNERQRETERRQREEAARLEREREKLRRERERIEQEKAELLRLERERQKLEREKLDRERMELKRQQMRLEESRRAPPPPSIKRTSSDRRDPRDLYVEPERKRMATEHSRRHSPDRVSDRRSDMMDRVTDRRLDPSPPPSRYESSRSAQDLGLKKEFKRSSEFSSRSSRPESFSDVSRGREVIVRRESLSSTSSSIDPRQVKERYERPSTTTYTREREVRRSDPETHRSSRDSHTRYNESFKPPGSNTPRESRYVESNRTPSGWHSGPTSSKTFNSVTSSGSRDPRNEPSSWSSRSSEGVNRWSNSSSMGSALRHPIPPTYQSGPIQSMGLAAPGTAPSYERFDAYKSSMPMRKY